MLKILLFTLATAGMLVYTIFIAVTEHRGKVWPWFFVALAAVLLFVTGGLLVGRLSEG